MKHTVVLLASLLAAPCFAEDFFNVDFNAAESGKAPEVQPYRRGEAAAAPTRLAMVEPGSAKVADKAGSLADKPLVLNFANCSDQSELIFDGGNSLATDGAVKIAFDVEPLTYKPGGKPGQETVFAVHLVGNNGVVIGILGYSINPTTSIGAINFYPRDGKAVPLGKFALEEAAKCEITLDLTQGVANIAMNGETTEKIPISTDRAFRLVQFRNGRALGGRDGAFSIAVDNVRISR